MKALAVAVGLLLLAANAAVGVWTVSELRQQGCQIDNLRNLEVTNSGVADDRVTLNGQKPLTLRARYPGARPC